jgi:hypothetical protein
MLVMVLVALAASGCNSFEDPNAVDASDAGTQDLGSDTQDTAAPDASTDNSDSQQGTDVMAMDAGTQDLGNTQDTATPDVATDNGPDAQEEVKQDSEPAPECTVAANCDDNSLCTTDFCDAGKCQHAPASGNCNDGNACTDNDTCVAGACKGTEKICNDSNPCTDDFCFGGECKHGVNTVACDDGNACTSKDTCFGAKCAGAVVNCEDNNPCTIDTCDSVSGCTFTPVLCEDGDPCTTDSCDMNGWCQFEVKSCNDNKDYTDDWCDSYGWYGPSGQCVNENKWNACKDSTYCVDGNSCTEDKCNFGTCSWVSKNCNDNDPCTTDSCSPAKGCINVAIGCDDNNSNTTDSCNKYGACINTPISTPPVVVPPTSGTTVKVEISCGAVACEVHPYFGADAGGKSFDNMGPASANGWYSTDLPKAQLCVWGMEVAARLSSMPSLPWFGCDVGAPSLNTVTVKVNGVVQPGVLTTHPWVCQGSGEGNKKYLPAAFGCP